MMESLGQGGGWCQQPRLDSGAGYLLLNFSQLHRLLAGQDKLASRVGGGKLAGFKHRGDALELLKEVPAWVGAVFSSLVVEETRMVATDMVQNNKVAGILEFIVQICERS